MVGNIELKLPEFNKETLQWIVDMIKILAKQIALLTKKDELTQEEEAGLRARGDQIERALDELLTKGGPGVS